MRLGKEHFGKKVRLPHMAEDTFFIPLGFTSKGYVLGEYSDGYPNYYQAREDWEEVTKTYHLGQRFLHGSTPYILARTGHNEVTLINLHSGNRWDAPVKVGNLSAISEAEFNQLRSYAHFELIKNEQNF